MNRLWLIAALVISALILTCAVKSGTEYANWFAKEQGDVQKAMDMLRDYPTAAGGKK